MTQLNDKLTTNPKVIHPYNTPNGWNERYRGNRGFGGAGTFAHSDKCNKYFYRSKFKALDRCLKVIGVDLRGKSVFDAAGGSGEFIDYFLNRGASQILVTDFAQTALDKVNRRHKKNPRVSTRLLTLSSFWLNLKDKNNSLIDKYDFVFLMESVFLLETDDDLAQAIKNLASVLKTGGYLIMSDLFPSHTIQENAYVVWRSKALFEYFLSRNGLFVVAYVPQTFVFNRHLFGRFQRIVEEVACPLLYWLDLIAINLGWSPPADSSANVKYLIAKNG